jgi:hypothetical protein
MAQFHSRHKHNVQSDRKVLRRYRKLFARVNSQADHPFTLQCRGNDVCRKKTKCSTCSWTIFSHTSSPPYMCTACSLIQHKHNSAFCVQGAHTPDTMPSNFTYSRNLNQVEPIIFSRSKNVPCCNPSVSCCSFTLHEITCTAASCNYHHSARWWTSFPFLLSGKKTRQLKSQWSAAVSCSEYYLLAVCTSDNSAVRCCQTQASSLSYGRLL